MKIKNAEISWLESGLPYSTEFQDIYYSKDNALAESQQVFVQANKLEQRWTDAAQDETFRIGELGFGAGLNFLQTCKLWQASEQRPPLLHYIAFEKHPLRRADLRRVLQCWPTLSEPSQLLLEQYIDHSEGCHRIRLASGITLDLYFGDAQEQLRRRMQESCPSIQCWFLDGFSPARNGQLWQESLMQLVAAASDQTTTLSSYSVAGHVRSAIDSAGFDVFKRDGFGRKRHSLFASRRTPIEKQAAADASAPTPWFILPTAQKLGRSVAIIGAGLAGCSTAYSLAQRGYKVTVFEAADSLAAGASGIARLALRCRLFNAPSAEAEFYLQAYNFALRQIQQLEKAGSPDWEATGLLQLHKAMNKRKPLQQDILQGLYSQSVVRLLDCNAASQQAGLALSDAAWYFAGGGAMNPVSLCEHYLAHPNIHCVRTTTITALQRTDGRWQLKTNDADVATADSVVIANSYSAAKLSQCTELPLQISRGQTTEIASNAGSESLCSVVSGERTVFPAKAGRHLLAASYAECDELQVSADDRMENLRLARETFSDKETIGLEALTDRVALRCNSPDRFPLVGMVPDVSQMRANYAELTRNAKARFTTSGHYHPGLYINVAHGSNGLASCPLSAELLASLIAGENLPCSRDIVSRLNPSRFLIRDLKQQK
ncbi:MAG: bifunctional tRNA (5-methylaminomethyl-2-thiouridine)(34)-methyltransferase MnmD/FAD-dependent 5-carboxymethylaminomethyl-2-thiouridine(34) oxidoreductase MnmC [Pseudohongiellaceae bacterium]